MLLISHRHNRLKKEFRTNPASKLKETNYCDYRLGTVNSKSFVSKVLLRIKWKFELTVHFKHEMLGK